jgi:hypothetical protein
MKKITLAILILAALAFGFASCDDGAAGGASWNPVGTWKCVRTTYGNGSVSYDQRYIFKSDGTFEEYGNGNLGLTGTYEYDNQGISLNIYHGILFFGYNSATKELEHEMPQETRFYAKQ